MTRGQIAEQIAARAMNLPAGYNVLRSREAKKFRTLYTEAYMAQHSEPVLIEPCCQCAAHPFPHIHPPAERAQAKRIFDAQRRQA